MNSALVEDYVTRCRQQGGRGNGQPSQEFIDIVKRGDGLAHFHGLFDSDCQCIGEMLGELQQKELDVSNNGLSATAVHLLLNGLPRDCMLRQLRVGGNRIGDDGAQILAERLSDGTLTNLASLDVRSIGMGMAGLSSLMAAVASAHDSANAGGGARSLTELNLEGNQINAQGAMLIADILKANRELRVLNLSSNALGDSGAAAIGGAIAYSSDGRTTGLRELLLASNNIADAGATALARGLSKLAENAASSQTGCAFCALNLNSNAIGDSGTMALAEVLQTHAKTLRLLELDLGCNTVRDDGVAALADWWQGNPDLKAVNLQGVELGARGARAVARALQQNTVLLQLILDPVSSSSVNSSASAGAGAGAGGGRGEGEQAQEEGLVAIASALASNTTLLQLSLGNFAPRDSPAARSIRSTVALNQRLASISGKNTPKRLSMLLGGGAEGASGEDQQQLQLQLQQQKQQQQLQQQQYRNGGTPGRGGGMGLSAVHTPTPTERAASILGHSGLAMSHSKSAQKSPAASMGMSMNMNGGVGAGNQSAWSIGPSSAHTPVMATPAMFSSSPLPPVRGGTDHMGMSVGMGMSASAASSSSGSRSRSAVKSLSASALAASAPPGSASAPRPARMGMGMGMGMGMNSALAEGLGGVQASGRKLGLELSVACTDQLKADAAASVEAQQAELARLSKSHAEAIGQLSTEVQRLLPARQHDRPATSICRKLVALQERFEGELSEVKTRLSSAEQARAMVAEMRVSKLVEGVGAEAAHEHEQLQVQLQGSLQQQQQQQQQHVHEQQRERQERQREVEHIQQQVQTQMQQMQTQVQAQVQTQVQTQVQEQMRRMGMGSEVERDASVRSVVETVLRERSDGPDAAKDEALQRLQEQVRWLDEDGVRARVEEEARVMARMQALERELGELRPMMQQWAPGGSGASNFDAMRGEVGTLRQQVHALAEALGPGRDALVRQITERVSQAVGALEARMGEASAGAAEAEAKVLQHKMVVLGQKLRQELEEDHQSAVTAIEVNRHIDYSRLEDRNKELAERVAVLEQTVTSEQEASLHALEAMMKAMGKGNGIGHQQ